MLILNEPYYIIDNIFYVCIQCMISYLIKSKGVASVSIMGQGLIEYYF